MLRPAPPLGRSPLGHGPVLPSQVGSGRRRLSPTTIRSIKRHVGYHVGPTTKRCCRQRTPEIHHHNPPPAAQAQLLTKPDPTTPPYTWTFLHLPPELRLLIYHHALFYPPAHTLFRRFRLTSTVTLTTPTLLLLCRQITQEALPVLHATPFALDALPPFVLGRPRPLSLLDFLPPRTLQAMRGEIELRLPLGRGKHGSGWAWGPVVEEVLGVLRGGNRCRAVRLVVTVKGTVKGTWEEGEGEGVEEAKRVDENEFREVVEMEEEWLARVGVLVSFFWFLEGVGFADRRGQMHDLAVNNPYWWCPGRVEEEIWVC